MAVSALAFAAEPTAPVASVRPAMSRAEIEAGLESHDRALYIKAGWIRDPYIILGPDDFFYLTGTTPRSNDERQKTDPYNRSLGQGSLVGSAVRIWRSKDLIDWQYLGAPFSLQDTAHYQENPDSIFRDKRRKIAGKYVHFGTAWSTDLMRKGFYNLYYCTADQITGPYGPRKFAGRFLGHGTPFQTRDGKWSCTAFFNANVPPLPREGIETRDLSEDAQTINQRGTTIVPLEVEILNDGDITIQAKDPAYATPGPDEAQQF